MGGSTKSPGCGWAEGKVPEKKKRSIDQAINKMSRIIAYTSEREKKNEREGE